MPCIFSRRNLWILKLASQTRVNRRSLLKFHTNPHSLINAQQQVKADIWVSVTSALCFHHFIVVSTDLIRYQTSRRGIERLLSVSDRWQRGVVICIVRPICVQRINLWEELFALIGCHAALIGISSVWHSRRGEVSFTPLLKPAISQFSRSERGDKTKKSARLWNLTVVVQPVVSVFYSSVS